MILFDGEIGKTYRVKTINVGRRATKRLNDMGITPDIEVKVIGKGCGVIVQVRGSKLALGACIARRVNVELVRDIHCSKKEHEFLTYPDKKEVVEPKSNDRCRHCGRFRFQIEIIDGSD